MAEGVPAAVLQNTFTHYGRKKTVEATFDGETLVLIGNRKKRPEIVKGHNLLRALFQGTPDGNGGDSLVVHFLRVCERRPNEWSLGSLRLCHRDHRVLRHWEAVLRAAAARGEGEGGLEGSRPKRLLVFVNPFGGRGRAQETYERKAAPVFRAAGVDCDAVRTRGPDHIAGHIAGCDDLAESFDGVVAVGGDGTFNQVMDALLRKENPSLDRTPPGGGEDAPPSSSRLRVGVIPSGSTDVVAYTLHGTSDPESAAMHIVMGNERRVDAMGVFVADKLRCFAVTIASRGFFGNNVAWSERLRWMGPSRYEAAGVINFVANKNFEGTARVCYS